MNAPKVKPWAVVMTQKEADALTARVAELEAALGTLVDHADSLRDFVSEGGSRSMVGAIQAIRDADTAMDAARAALKGAA